jgi:ketosteroid isomerase-like protein
MSRENVELIRTGIEAWNRRDWDGALAAFHPQIEWRNAGVLLDDAEVYYGHEQVRSFWESWADSWDDIRIEPEEFIDLGDRVLALVRFRASGRNQIEIDQQVAQLFTLRGDLVLSFQSYWDRAEALEATGLRE